MYDPITLDVSKGNGYRIQAMPMSPPDDSHECDNFGEVLSHILYYHQILPIGQQIRLGRNPFGLDESQIKDLEVLIDMHNQLAEIKETFDSRKTD